MAEEKKKETETKAEEAKEAEAEVKAETVEKELEVLKEPVEEVVVKPGETPVPIVVAMPAVEAEEHRAVLNWKPKTKLGREVFEGKVKSLDDILKDKKRILESEIVDTLAPNIKSELIFIGGRAGKGGGKQRIPVMISAAMHRSGRRFTMNSFVVVGDENGLVGIGKGSAVESRDAIEKALRKAKMGIARIKRGCGSWECDCGGEHSIPYKVKGGSGSVRAIIMPAPKGLGLVADDESKKILRLAGIKDVWMKTYGNTSMRLNLMKAIFNALKQLYVYER